MFPTSSKQLGRKSLNNTLSFVLQREIPKIKVTFYGLETTENFKMKSHNGSFLSSYVVFGTFFSSITSQDSFSAVTAFDELGELYLRMRIKGKKFLNRHPR